MITNYNTELNDNSLVPFNSFLKSNGRSASCGWRWRQQGWITTVNIAGRLYVSQDEVDRFQQRAAAGEFAKRSRTAVFVYDDPVAASIIGRSTAGNTETVGTAEDQKTAVTQVKQAVIG
jgi:hypothetical protein